MTDLLQLETQKPVPAQSQPPRRPGWGLIQDVRSRPTPRSFARVQPEARPQPLTKPINRVVPQKPVARTLPEQSKQRWAKRHIRIICAPIIIIASILLSSVPIVGEILIVAYGVVAVVRHIPSRTSFWLATIILAGIGLEFLLLPQVGRVDNSALFVFLLLIIGFLSVNLETRRMQRQEKAIRVDNTTARLPAKTQG